MKILYSVTLAVLLLFSSAYADSKFDYFYETAGISAEQHELRKAIKYYNKAFERAKTKKQKIKALGGLVSANERLGHKKSARLALKTLLRIDPKNKWALKKLRKKKARNKSSNKFSYYYENAGIAAKEDDYYEAIEFYTKAFEVARTKKEKVKALGGLVTSYEYNDQYSRARAALRALLKIDPKNKWALKKI